MASSLSGSVRNAVVALLAPLPSVLFYLSFLHHHAAVNPDSLSPLWNWCFHHPLLLANVLFFFNVSLLFWLIGLHQNRHWLIDLYWTIIPVLLLHYFANHPLAEYNRWRSRLVTLLTWIWSVRIAHMYFRRDGGEEDWRVSDLRRQYGENWWWMSFFSIYLAHQILLMGITLPLYVVHSSDKQFNLWDLVAALLCLTGVAIAYFADTQLYNFTCRNEALKRQGQVLVPVLDKGLWCYSRHPNYFGEQLWWSGLGIFAWNVLGHGWTFIGALINACCLAYLTFLVEERMLKQLYRAEVYKHYQRTTSVWIPWFNPKPKET